MMERDNQPIIGIADFVLENEGELMLVDYKTLQEMLIESKCKTSSGQLNLYMVILK